MAKIDKSDKQKITRKLLKIERKGLLQYREFLIDQYSDLSNKKAKMKFALYLEEQVINTDKRLKKIGKKIRSSS